MKLNDKQCLTNLVRKYTNCDVKKMALERNRFIKQGISLDNFNSLLIQITARQKTTTKFKTINQNYDFLFPSLLAAEQASSEITANYKSKIISNYKISADITGGLGIDSLCFAKYSDKHIYCEKDERYCDYFQYNSTVLNYKNINIINKTAEDFIEDCINNSIKFDILYVDPARRNINGTRKLLLCDLMPNIVNMQHKWKQITNNVIIKLSPMFDIKESIKLIANIWQIHVVSVNNECKELLLILKYENNTVSLNSTNNNANEILYYAVNITNTQENVLFIDNKFATNNEINYSYPLQYIYEPNASLMKLGNWSYVSNKYNLSKLHANTHLWTSDKYINKFAGKCFELKNIIPYSKDAIAKANIKQANIKIRNFPYSIAEIKKKIKINEGSNSYIFATSIINNKLVILEVKPIK